MNWKISIYDADYTAELLYQAFKERLMAEIVGERVEWTERMERKERFDLVNKEQK